jgi:inhibitor of cysteine peptidase
MESMHMNTKWLTLLYSMAILSVVGGCGVNPYTGQTIPLDDRDNGSTIQARQTDRLLIVLPANPSTGFSWVRADSDEPITIADKQNWFVPLPSLAGAVGQSGVQVFEFVVGLRGTSELRLELRQSGAPSTDAPADVFSVTVEAADVVS